MFHILYTSILVPLVDLRHVELVFFKNGTLFPQSTLVDALYLIFLNNLESTFSKKKKKIIRF